MTTKEISEIRVNNKPLRYVNGKKLNQLTINDTTYTLVKNIYLYIALDNDEMSELEFNLKKGTEIFVNSTNGYISFNGETYFCGSKSGYSFDYWTVNGQIVSTTSTFTLTSETLIFANWVESAEYYNVIVNVSGFDVTVDGKRKNLISSETFSGAGGSTYTYTISAILNINSLTYSVPGLQIVGVTDLNGAQGLPNWSDTVNPSQGSSTPPSTLKNNTDNISLKITRDDTISWFYVYSYNGYYFV